jgi:hypothetical protein
VQPAANKVNNKRWSPYLYLIMNANIYIIRGLLWR